MSSSPLATDEHHNFVSFGHNIDKVYFDEPAPAENHKTDLLNLRITEVLGPFQDVSPRLLSDLNEDPDLLYGIDTPNTPSTPLSSKGASPSLGASFLSNSPKHHKQRHHQHNSEQKPGRMMGPNGRSSSPAKRHPPKHLLNQTGAKPLDRNNAIPQQRKQHHLADVKPSRPIPPLSAKHGYRSHLPSPNTGNTNSPFSNKAETGGDQKMRLKKPLNPANNAFSINKRPDRPREREDTSINSKKLLQSDAFNFQKSALKTERVSPKEDPKPMSAASGRPVNSQLEKSKQPMNRPTEEGVKRRQVPNLDLSLDRHSDAHDDSFNQLFLKGMEPLPTPLDDIKTPVTNKKFVSFPNPSSRNSLQQQQTEPQIRPPLPIRQSSPVTNESVVHQNSSSSDSSESESDSELPSHQKPDPDQIIDDMFVSSDSDSSDSSPMDQSFQQGIEEVFPSSPLLKKSDTLSSSRNRHSSFSSDSSDGDEGVNVWNKNSIDSSRSTHTPSSLVKTERYSTSSNRFSSPRDVKPSPRSLDSASHRYKNNMVRGHEMHTDDSDNMAPDRKRLKVSISLEKIALRNSLDVSISRDKISLSSERPVESKQMARVQPIQRHIPDSNKDNPAPLPPHSHTRGVSQVFPPQRISRKSPHNMKDFQSPDLSWPRDTCYDSSQIVTSTPNPSPIVPSAPSRWPGGNNDPPFVPRPTKVLTSHDYLTEAKRLKHQADRYKSNYDKALYYCEAALSFMLYGDQLELTSKSSATSTYSDTFNLLDFVLRPSTSSEGGLGFSNECYPKLIFICLRCQSVIFNRIFVIRQETLRSSHKELHDFFSGYKSDTKAKTPVSNSPYADSQWSPSNMVSVPQKIANINSDYLQVMEYSFRSLELWNKSQTYEEDSLPFIQKLNNSIGKSIERFSSIKDTTAWCKLGLNWLKSDRT